MFEKIMNAVMADSIRPDFVRGKIRIPEGVNAQNLKKCISEYFADVHIRRGWIYYSTPWLPF